MSAEERGIFLPKPEIERILKPYPEKRTKPFIRPKVSLKRNQVVDQRPPRLHADSADTARTRNVWKPQVKRASDRAAQQALRRLIPTATKPSNLRHRSDSDPVSRFLKTAATTIAKNVEGNIPGTPERKRRAEMARKQWALFQAGKIGIEDLHVNEGMVGPGNILKLLQAGRGTLKGLPKDMKLDELYDALPKAAYKETPMGRVPASTIDGPAGRIPWIVHPRTGSVRVGPPGSQHGRLQTPEVGHSGRQAEGYEGWLYTDFAMGGGRSGSIHLAEKGIQGSRMNELPRQGVQNLQNLLNILLGPRSPIDDNMLMIPTRRAEELSADELSWLLETFRAGKRGRR